MTRSGQPDFLLLTVLGWGLGRRAAAQVSSSEWVRRTRRRHLAAYPVSAQQEVLVSLALNRDA